MTIARAAALGVALAVVLCPTTAVTQTAPARALDTLMRLTSLLRGVLRSEGEWTTLGRELELIAAYLDIEHARFEERLRVRIEVPDELFAQVSQHYAGKELLDLCITIGAYNMVSRFLIALGVTPESDDAGR